MFKKMTITMAAAAIATTGVTAMPTSAIAQNYYHHHHHRQYRGQDGNYRRDAYQNQDAYRHCGSGNGAVGTVAGGAGGAVLGNVLGGGTLGTVAGGIGGALLGRHFDKQHTRDRNAERNGC